MVEQQGEEFDATRAMAATRSLVLAELGRRLQRQMGRLQSWDSECDRALQEMWRLLRWIEGRASRNESR